MLTRWYQVVLLGLPVAIIAWAAWRLWHRRGRGGGVGPGAAGAFYELLSEDRRKVVELVAEGRAERREAEDRDGNLPDLENPRGAGPPE